jgi:hypothetical protein
MIADIANQVDLGEAGVVVFTAGAARRPDFDWRSMASTSRWRW